MKRRIFQTSLIATALTVAGLSGAQAQQTIRLTAAGGHPPVFLWVKLLDEFYIPEVDRRLAAAGGKHKVEWTKAWGGTLIKIGSESKASPTASRTSASWARCSRPPSSRCRTSAM